MKTIARTAVTAGLVLAGLGLSAGSASAAPSAAPVAAPAASRVVAAPAAASAWFYYRTYRDLNTCNYVGFITVANGWARGSTCYARAGAYDLYLLQ